MAACEVGEAGVTEKKQSCDPTGRSGNKAGRASVKDIHDLHGVHGNGLKHAAVTLVVHHHHEEVAAGDLLDHKGPAGGRKRDVNVTDVWESGRRGSTLDVRREDWPHRWLSANTPPDSHTQKHPGILL